LSYPASEEGEAQIGDKSASLGSEEDAGMFLTEFRSSLVFATSDVHRERQLDSQIFDKRDPEKEHDTEHITSSIASLLTLDTPCNVAHLGDYRSSLLMLDTPSDGASLGGPCAGMPVAVSDLFEFHSRQQQLSERAYEDSCAAVARRATHPADAQSQASVHALTRGLMTRSGTSAECMWHTEFESGDAVTVEERERDREILVHIETLLRDEPPPLTQYFSGTIPTAENGGVGMLDQEEEVGVEDGEWDMPLSVGDSGMAEEGRAGDGEWDMPVSAGDLQDLAHLSHATRAAIGEGLVLQ